MRAPCHRRHGFFHNNNHSVAMNLSVRLTCTLLMLAVVAGLCFSNVVDVSSHDVTQDGNFSLVTKLNG